MDDSVSYTISVIPDTGYFTGTPQTPMTIQVHPGITASYEEFTTTVFETGNFSQPKLSNNTINNKTWTGLFSGDTLPAGLIIEPQTGAIYGRPEVVVADATDYVITLTGRNDFFGVNTTATVTITINALPDTPPDAPTGVTIDDWATNYLSLSWTAAGAGSVAGAEGTISGYTVYYNTRDDFTDLVSLKAANTWLNAGTGTSTGVGGLESGKLYYFAVTATNAAGEGAVSDSIETHTNTANRPDAPVLYGRSADSGRVELTWVAPAAGGWIDGQPIVVSRYNVYRHNGIIDSNNVSGLTAIASTGPAQLNYIASNLVNGDTYYFAVTTMAANGLESVPNGGSVSVIPNVGLSPINATSFAVSVDDFEAETHTDGQFISVDIEKDGLAYGIDYNIAISRSGTAISNNLLSYDPITQRIAISSALALTDAGTYTISASGIGNYNNIVSDNFKLTVVLSNIDLLELAVNALDYSDIQFATDESEDNVLSNFTLPLAGINQTSIEWRSRDVNFITISGAIAEVTQPDNGAKLVTLAATVRRGGEFRTKNFTFEITQANNTTPEKPTGLTVTDWATDSIDISWTAPHPGFENNVAGYHYSIHGLLQ